MEVESKKRKTYYLSLKVENPEYEIKNVLGGTHTKKAQLPNGCVGMCLVFKTKKAAGEWNGKNTLTAPIQFDCTTKVETNYINKVKVKP